MTDAATASSRTMKGRNMVVVFFSRAGENYEVGEVTVAIPRSLPKRWPGGPIRR